MSKKDANKHLKALTKETPEGRKERVSSGVKFRHLVFQDKKKRELNRRLKTRELMKEEKDKD